MRVRFWGTRGSLPVALNAAQVRTKIARALLMAGGRRFEALGEAQRFVDELPFAVGQTFGGATSCVEIELNAPGTASHDYILCDLGSGLRKFGNCVLERHGPQTANTFHVFVSHMHWDHIMGFPFFTPAYLPGNTVKLYGCHPNLGEALLRQQDPPSFPVPLPYLQARIEFEQLKPGVTHEVAGMRVTPLRQRHAGDSYGYRFETANRTLVYSTDSEHKLDRPDETRAFIDFFRDADLVIFDAMYSLADTISVKEDWGHSSNVVGVELCQLAGARHLVLFHHEPVYEDQQIAEVEEETRQLESLTRDSRAPLRVTAAYDGLEIEL